MPDEHLVLEQQYRDLDLRSSCLFTGVKIDKSRGEHVIPEWMQKDYALRRHHVEMGEASRLAMIMQFRAPAEEKANNLFGQIENRVKLNQATRDELHLWSKKLAVGILWNHHRLAQNSHHPHAPRQFDDRLLRFALMDFHREFAEFRAGSYVRSGSTLIVPTNLAGFLLVDCFGATVDTGFSATHDAIWPYAFVAVSHGGQLFVSTLYDSDRALESGRLLREWNSSGLRECTDGARIRAGFAVIFAQEIVWPLVNRGGQISGDHVIRYVAFQLGIIIERHGDDIGYRRRLPSDAPPPPIIQYPATSSN